MSETDGFPPKAASPTNRLRRERVCGAHSRRRRRSIAKMLERMQEDGEAMLIDDAGRFNRAAIMAKAHHEFRMARMRGDGRSFGHWLLAKDLAM